VLSTRSSAEASGDSRFGFKVLGAIALGELITDEAGETLPSWLSPNLNLTVRTGYTDSVQPDGFHFDYAEDDPAEQTLVSTLEGPGTWVVIGEMSADAQPWLQSPEGTHARNIARSVDDLNTTIRDRFSGEVFEVVELASGHTFSLPAGSLHATPSALSGGYAERTFATKIVI
jgi:hypothetical protein